jgi:hypothetical protein
MKTKYTQTDKVLDFINHAGFITTRHAQSLHILSPRAIIKKAKEELGMRDMTITTKNGKRIKIDYTSRKAALGYMRKIGGRVA